MAHTSTDPRFDSDWWDQRPVRRTLAAVAVVTLPLFVLLGLGGARSLVGGSAMGYVPLGMGTYLLYLAAQAWGASSATGSDQRDHVRTFLRCLALLAVGPTVTWVSYLYLLYISG